MTTTPDPTTIDAARTSRRRAILGLAGAAAAGATAVVAGAEPASAAGQGQGMTLGDPGNTASATTGLTATVPNLPALAVTNTSYGSAVTGQRETGSGIRRPIGAIVGDAHHGEGVAGLSHWHSGVMGSSVRQAGVHGKSQMGVGVAGQSDAQIGVYGQGNQSLGIGVFGSGAGESNSDSAGVLGHNPSGPALVGMGRLQARFVPADAPGPPTRVSGYTGSFHLDSLGVLRFAVANRTWRILAAPNAAGAFHVLAAPARVYDSRPGTKPDVGPKSKLVAGEARTVDLKANGSGVPAGATAALVTVLLVNAPEANGNLTVWAAGVARPQANTLVWGGDAGRFTTQATTALDAEARIQVLASHATDVVIDVVGYYA